MAPLCSNNHSESSVAFDSSDLAALKHSIDCGPVCEYDTTLEQPSKNHVAPISFDCDSVFMRTLSKCPGNAWPPPEKIPVDEYKDFTMDSKIPVKKLYLHQRYDGTKGYTSKWLEDDIDVAIKSDSSQTAVENFSTYGQGEVMYVDAALKEFRHAIHGKVGLVLGSERPWLEVLLLRAGAKHVVTVEYGKIESLHPRLSVTTPSEFAAFTLKHQRHFDFAATFSSLEHSGLGRYGDSLDPFSDLQAAAETWCALRPGGIFFLGLPAVDAAASRDELHWNAHRLYGPKRLAQMFRGFRFVKTIETGETGSSASSSIMHILQKPYPS
jgi:hypothetical protein